MAPPEIEVRAYLLMELLVQRRQKATRCLRTTKIGCILPRQFVSMPWHALPEAEPPSQRATSHKNGSESAILGLGDLMRSGFHMDAFNRMIKKYELDALFLSAGPWAPLRSYHNLP